ncbi:MAG: CHRD domain-containing protein [Actinobacteria bacterium]|nr:CHRD domain-containing protein [Actinomycetota bacterium]
MKRITTLGTVFVVGLVAVGLAVAGANRNWSTHANGEMEVPVRDTQGQGQAIFRLAKDGESIDYKLIASNIENVVMAHIHTSTGPGANGGIVVWLYPSTAVGIQAPAGGGRTNGVLAEGTITAANLTGALEGKQLADLVAALDGGTAYVNFHTNDGVLPANTGPGDFPGGEIRGDIN